MRILAFTSIRSEYDLMSLLYKKLNKDPNVDFKLLVSGAHLSRGFGYSVQQIEQDNLPVLAKIETILHSDSAVARIKSASFLLQSAIEVVDQFKPDLMIYAGDREDILVYAMIGAYLSIPTVHFYSGDHSPDGYVDNPVRHAASKLATAHVVALQQHHKRLVRMGELPKRICVAGSVALDRFVDFKPFSLGQIAEKLELKIELNKFALLIFHPITEEIPFVAEYFTAILESLLKRNIVTFVGYPNIDPGNSKLVEVINRYQSRTNFIFYKNLDRDLFLSIYKHASFIIGNSSSGVCEAASLKIPAINVGMRQRGRPADANVIFCDATENDIGRAIDNSQSESFQRELQGITNSYGDGNSVEKAYRFLLDTDFKSMLAKYEDPLLVEIE